MTQPALADIEDLADELGVASDTLNEQRAQAVLRRASAKAYALLPAGSYDDEADPEVTPPDLVRFTVAAAAARAYGNPLGYTQKTVGDVSVAIDRAVASVFFTTEERADLRSAAGVASLTSIAVASPYPAVPPADYDDTGWSLDAPWT